VSIQREATTEHNLHKSLRFLFVIAQMFGYFPVLGVLSSSPSYLGFSWFSLRILSSTVTYTCGIVVILGHIRFLIVEGYEQIEMSKFLSNSSRPPIILSCSSVVDGVIFYSSGTLSCMLFIKLAIEWKQNYVEVAGSGHSYGVVRLAQKFGATVKNNLNYFSPIGSRYHP
jgi:hypothetical protein